MFLQFFMIWIGLSALSFFAGVFVFRLFTLKDEGYAFDDGEGIFVHDRTGSPRLTKSTDDELPLETADRIVGKPFKNELRKFVSRRSVRISLLLSFVLLGIVSYLVVV